MTSGHVIIAIAVLAALFVIWRNIPDTTFPPSPGGGRLILILVIVVGIIWLIFK